MENKYIVCDKKHYWLNYELNYTLIYNSSILTHTHIMNYYQIAINKETSATRWCWTWNFSLRKLTLQKFLIYTLRFICSCPKTSANSFYWIHKIGQVFTSNYESRAGLKWGSWRSGRVVDICMQSITRSFRSCLIRY